MGHIDGTVENGTRIDCYRGGNREYLDGEEMLCQWKMMYNQGQE
jgi:hypothetical protein